MIETDFMMKNNKKCQKSIWKQNVAFFYSELAPMTRDAPDFREMEKI